MVGAGSFLPLDDLGLTTNSVILTVLLQRQWCHSSPKGSKRIKPKYKGNKNSQVTIWQRCYQIFTKHLSNFQQYLPITILRQKFRSNGGKMKEKVTEKMKMCTFVEDS